MADADNMYINYDEQQLSFCGLKTKQFYNLDFKPIRKFKSSLQNLMNYFELFSGNIEFTK